MAVLNLAKKGSAPKTIAFFKVEKNLFEVECKSKFKGRDGRGFLRAGKAAPRDFPRAKPKGNPE